MDLLCRRVEYGKTYTISRLYINDVYECFVLEDVVRADGVKVDSATAIPSGKYKVIITFSAHMQKTLPYILDVPGFAGIRIHSGNTSADTEGCLLLGQVWGGGDMIGQSRAAFDHFFPQLQAALADHEDVTIEIVDTK